jgi:ADP-ribose pyrophosphatase
MPRLQNIDRGLRESAGAGYNLSNMIELKDSKTIFAGGLLTLKLDRIVLPGAREADREYVVFGRSVLLLPIARDDRVVLVSQYRHPAGDYLLELPAGKVDEGESPEEAAARELAEETGYRAERLVRFGEFFLAPGYSTELMTAFVATGLVPGEKSPDPDEILSNVLLTKEEVISGLMSARFRDAKTILGLLWWVAEGFLAGK